MVGAYDDLLPHLALRLDGARYVIGLAGREKRVQQRPIKDELAGEDENAERQPAQRPPVIAEVKQDGAD